MEARRENNVMENRLLEGTMNREFAPCVAKGKTRATY
jgi:hypothetical protein